VLRDPWGNEFRVLQPEFPELLAAQPPWSEQAPASLDQLPGHPPDTAVVLC